MATVGFVARYRWVVLFLAFISQFSNGLSGQVVAPLAPLFQSELALSKAEVGFFASAAYAGAWGVLLVAGSLADRAGARLVMSVGQIVAGVLMLSMAMVGSFLQAVAVMFVAGLGRGAVAPGVAKAIVEWFPPTARGTVMGVKQTAVPIAGILTGATLPAIALAMGWRSAIALVGLLLVACGSVALILYRDPGRPGQGVGRKVSMGAGLAAMIRNRYIWTLGAIATLLCTAQLALLAHQALYFKEIVLVPLVPDEGARVLMAGGYLALNQAGGVVGRVFWGILSDRVFRGRLVVLSMIGGLSAAMALVMGFLGPGYPLWVWTVVVFLYGASANAWTGLHQALIAEAAGRRLAATGVGFGMTMSQAGAVVGPPLFGFIVDLSGTYRTAWFFLCSISAAATLMSIWCSKQEKRVE